MSDHDSRHNKAAIKRWHNAYQRALITLHSNNGVVRIFESLVGSPPVPSDNSSSSSAYQVYIALLSDLQRMQDFDSRYPLAVVAFGSARLTKEDRYYVLARDVGKGLADRGYLVRTGAGPGIMDAVPEGWKSVVVGGGSDGSCLKEKTQGIRIELPFEQAISASIDTNTMMSTFSIRRTALIWNSRAIAVFPGGMGTINELFEAWVGACDGKVVCPIAVVPNSFYKPLLDSIEHVAVEERKLIKASDFHLVLNAGENVDEAVQLLIQPMRYKDSGTQFTLREKLIYLRHELGRGITAVSRLDPAVIVMGSDGDCLSESDREVQFLSDLTTSLLNKTSFGIRLGVAGMIHNVVTKTAQRHHNRIQRILMTEAMGFIEADAYFESRSAHCETLLCNAKAAVFFPSDLPALNDLFALVCEIQTRRRRRMPVFLVGREYWQPIFDGLAKTLKGEYDGQYIKHTDMNIMTVIGTTQHDLNMVMEAINAHEEVS